MSAKKSFFFKLSVAAVVFITVMLVISSVLITAQTATTPSTPWVDDWTHHHMVFSHPGTAAEAMAQGRIEEWSRTVNNPRYQLQQLKRSSTQAALSAAPDFAARMEILRSTNEMAMANNRRRQPVPDAPIKKDWSVGLDSATAAGSINVANAPGASFPITGGTSTLTVGSVTFTTSAPVAEVATISVPSSTYCFPATSTGVTVGTGPTNVLTNATVQSGGSVTVAGNGETGAVTIGGVVYTWEASVGATGCGSTLNCIKMSASGSGTQGHANSAEALYRAINNTGASTCSNTGATNPCYALATGQGANAEATATYTANAAAVTIGTWKCAGAFAITDTAGDTLAQPTGGSNGTAGTGVFALPSPASGATLSANINTAIGNSGASGFTKSYTSPTITLTASAKGSTGINDSLHGAVTGVNVAVTTTGTDGTPSNTAFTYWLGNAYDTQPQLATAIATAINNNTTLQLSGGVSASASGNVVSLAARTAGGNPALSDVSFTALSLTAFSGGESALGSVLPNAFPAMYGASLTTASCSDFVVFPTGVAGSATTANIAAYTNLYTTGCSGSVPSVLWAYNTDTGYTVTTSPVMSLDGTKVAFIESTSSASELVILPTASGGGSVGSPAANPGTMTITALSHHDTYSSPYYDAAYDSLYVGDDSGDLEKFTGVFGGTVSSPATDYLGKGNPLASPVLDDNSGCVFVGDTTGYLYSVNSGVSGTRCTAAYGTVKATSAVLASAANGGIFDGPMVDGSAGSVYVFVTSSAFEFHTGFCNTGNNCVDQFPTNFGPTASPSVVEYLGTGGVGYPLFGGTFDNVYYSSAAPTGNLYALGNTGVTTGGNLYRVPIASNVPGATVTAVTGVTAAAYPWPSPITEFCNNGTSACVVSAGATTVGNDYIFFSVNQGTPTGCTSTVGNGCILSYKVNTTTPALSGSGLNVTTPGTSGCWATGGIVIDNSATGTTGAQQIYFVNLNGAAAVGTNSCTAGTASANATQASQANP